MQSSFRLVYLLTRMVWFSIIQFQRMKKGKKIQISNESMKKWKEQKESEQLKLRQQQQGQQVKTQQPNRKDFPAKVQQITDEWQMKLSLDQVAMISQQHPSLANLQVLACLFKELDTLVIPKFKSQSNPQLIQLYSIFRGELDQFLKQTSNQRKGAFKHWEPQNIRQNPKDQRNKEIAINYSYQIKQLQDEYNRKKSFKKYANEHLMSEKTELEDLIKQRAQRVSVQTVRQRFVPHYQSKMDAMNKELYNSQGRCNQTLINTLKLAAQSNKLEREMRKRKRKDQVKELYDLRRKLCTVNGNSLGHFQILHDCFA